MDKRVTVPLALLLVALVNGCAVQPADPADPATEFGNQFGTLRYEIKPGDNLVLIAADITHERENWRRIADFNRIDNPASIKVGQVIYIPRDLIPLDTAAPTREVAGRPSATVSTVKPSDSIQTGPLPQ